MNPNDRRNDGCAPQRCAPSLNWNVNADVDASRYSTQLPVAGVEHTGGQPARPVFLPTSSQGGLGRND